MNNEYLEITDRLQKNESRIAWLALFAGILFLGYLFSIQAEYNAEKNIKKPVYDPAYRSLRTFQKKSPKLELQADHY